MRKALLPAALTTRSGGREPRRASAKRTPRGALAADPERAFGGRVGCTSRPVGGRSQVVCLKGNKIVGHNVGARTPPERWVQRSRRLAREYGADPAAVGEHRFG